ncbi:PAS domain-containing protein [uncultured Caulobacter sp.]|uniref:photosensory histidine protein kinase LovK n=1 Tax=uncultured Caulobacter sp. TaxID=158749 RepID=UPI002611AEA2|nr:PAS domain-containing protein [uncultured Caulobacter sp.]
MDNHSESRRAEDRLAGHGVDDPFAAAVRASRMAMVVADAQKADSPIVFANDAFLRLTGYERDEVIGRNCRFLQGPETDPEAVAALRQAIAGGEDIAIDLLNYRKDGSTFWNALYLSPVRDDAGEVVYFFGAQLDVTDKKAIEFRARDHSDGLQQAVDDRADELSKALEQKTALLHEVDHRVKNNLQLISSLLLLQNRRVADPALKASLKGMLGRVNAIATVHRRLFQSEDVERFDVSAFIRDMVADLMGSTARDDIEVGLDLERVDIPASKAAPFALVVNELLTNCVRHGFPEGRGGRILISVRRQNGDFRIEIADDGVGFDKDAKPSGFGLTIVQLLCQQLKAKYETADAEPGARVVVLLPVNGAH